MLCAASGLEEAMASYFHSFGGAFFADVHNFARTSIKKWPPPIIRYWDPEGNVGSRPSSAPAKLKVAEQVTPLWASARH